MFDIELAIATALERKTERERAEDARFQAEQRAKLPQLSDVDLKLSQGIKTVAFAEFQLKDVTDAEQIAFEYTRMAEGYALQGDFATAVKLTADDTKRAEYQKILDAFNNVACGCPKVQHKHSTLFVKDKFYANGAVKNLIACSICGNLTINA